MFSLTCFTKSVENRCSRFWWVCVLSDVKTTSVPHEFGGAKRERLLDKVSATSMRTAEVTVCIIPERLLDRPRQLPHAWKPRLSKTKSTMLRPGYLFCSWSTTTSAPSPFTKSMSSPAAVTVPAPRTLATWILMKLVPFVTTTVGFEDQERLLPADTASWSLQRWGSCQLSPTTMRKI